MKSKDEIDEKVLKEIIALGGSITKKKACEMLGINYNVARLDKLIENYIKGEEIRKKRLKSNRGKPLSDEEMGLIILGVLQKEPISEIADTIGRSPAFINIVIRRKLQFPERLPYHTYLSPAMLPRLEEDFSQGDIVYSAKYDVIAEVMAYLYHHEIHGNVYRIYLHGDWNQYACQPAYELMNLSPFIKKYNVKVKL